MRPTFAQSSKFFNEPNKQDKMKSTSQSDASWNEQKDKLKQKFALITDKDLVFERGRKDEMLGRLQIKLGKDKEELNKIMQAL